MHADAEVKSDLQGLLEEFKDVFPTELPLKTPPNRGIGDVHHINVEPGSVPPAKAAYRQSPAEQLLIKK